MSEIVDLVVVTVKQQRYTYWSLYVTAEKSQPISFDNSHDGVEPKRH